MVAVDSSAGSVSKGVGMISKSLATIAAREVKKGTATQAAADARVAATLARIATSTDLGALAECDLIIEAAPETVDIKKSVYGSLAKIARQEALIASNTSGMEVRLLGGFYGRPAAVGALHYFNPVQIMQLCEVIGGEGMPAGDVDRLAAFVREQGRTPVRCKDTPGFIVNRLLVPYLAQAIAMVQRGDASLQDVDVGMKLGAGHPMGPLELADYVGLDTTLHILNNWTRDYPKEPAFFVPQLLKDMVAAGKLGRKTGQGFYRWEGGKAILK